MVSMDQKTAVKNYQFAERAKSELIILSQLCMALPSIPEEPDTSTFIASPPGSPLGRAACSGVPSR